MKKGGKRREQPHIVSVANELGPTPLTCFSFALQKARGVENNDRSVFPLRTSLPKVTDACS